MKPKVIILCGGYGMRLQEETAVKPKPMVEIGGKPILWHIMMLYSYYGFNRFVIALGYKGDIIKNYFMHYFLLNNDFRIDLSTGQVEIMTDLQNDWQVELVDTGKNTMTGGRVKRLEKIIGNETFLLTYGDGVSNVDIEKLYNFHRERGRVATVTAVRPKARFGAICFEGNLATGFSEKNHNLEGWINGGFFVCEPTIFQYLTRGDAEMLERDPLEKLVSDRELNVYPHQGFWQCMDTLRDKELLEEYWATDNPPWRVWEDKCVN